MSVYYYEPFYNFDRFLDEFLAGPRSNNNQQRIQQTGQNEGNAVSAILKPRMDLHEDSSKNAVTATFELPGMKKEDIQIDVHDGRLTVSGETKTSEEHEKDGYAVRERRFGKFSRTLRLPQGVKDEEIKASMENGVLTVTFPKLAPETAPKKITIS
ncbi:HSP20-like chaperone [Dendrothele bispora CBS 962.96]|uniref:HSP20-like chaperone n=1 Tax=Dendrothele bispora (strain CBS 962.96) TaxID=1314807 RepID=A0A4S8LX86_DENBC|nr:HSP20-like chaperone [Dendrothele bispora CBS 962.96]